MKHLTTQQIEQVKALQPWDFFTGNKKVVGYLLAKDVKEIIEKKGKREALKHQSLKKSNVKEIRELVDWSLKTKGTRYFKVLIEGNTGIYYASPSFGHSDYNKSRVFEKNDKTLKLMHLFNKIVNR